VRLFLLSMICAFALSLSAADPPPDLFENPVIRSLFADLLRLGGFGQVNTERAAFLVRDANGEYRCVLWPATLGFKRERFSGIVPAGTVALFHTHPNQSPFGSVSDQRASLILKVPVFTLTRRSIYVITGRSENIAIVRGRVWATLSPEQRCQ
jgi:hypothetical protein